MKNLRHPCVQWIMKEAKNKHFIANDVVMG